MTGLRVNELMGPGRAKPCGIPCISGWPEPWPPRRRAGSITELRSFGKVARHPDSEDPYIDRQGVREIPNCRRYGATSTVYAVWANSVLRAISKAASERLMRRARSFHNMEEVKRAAPQFLRFARCWQFSKRSGTVNSIKCSPRRLVADPHFRLCAKPPPPDAGWVASAKSLNDEGGAIGFVFVTSGFERARRDREARNTPANLSRACGAGARGSIRNGEACEGLPRASRRWGFPDPPRLTDAGAVQLAIRGSVIASDTSLSESGRSAGFGNAASRRYRRATTDGMMMDPEAERQRAGVHHPECAYFTAAK